MTNRENGKYTKDDVFTAETQRTQRFFFRLKGENLFISLRSLRLERSGR